VPGYTLGLWKVRGKGGWEKTVMGKPIGRSSWDGGGGWCQEFFKGGFVNLAWLGLRQKTISMCERKNLKEPRWGKCLTLTPSKRRNIWE